ESNRAYQTKSALLGGNEKGDPKGSPFFVCAFSEMGKGLPSMRQPLGALKAAFTLVGQMI
ncbi:hypothetical protein, partial [Pseudomonas viridiflava]|uniref:hypothetical protein n=1 Tax=Pseudomonas viridiflava TaxID=33069 RepID=UPI001E636ADB